MPDRNCETQRIQMILKFSVIAFLACAAFVIRSLPYRNFLGARGNYLLYGPDSYDHVRRIMLGIASFPRVPLFDYYYGYPVGTAQIWSPLFDYIVSIIAILAGGGEQTVYTIGFWLPPLLAAATVVMVWLTAERMLGTGTGFVAALIMVVLPGHILYSFVSELDNNVAEPLLFLGIMLTLLKWTPSAGSVLSSANRLPGWLRTAGWLVFALLIWRGSVIFWGIAFGTLLMELLFKRNNPAESDNIARYATNAFAAAGLILALFCFAGWMGATGGLNSRTTSWFHVFFLIGCAVAIRLFVLLLRSRTAGKFLFVLGGVAAIFLVAALLPVTRGFVLQLSGGLGVVFSRDPWLDSISELRPMLYPTGSFDPWHSVETLSLLYWLAPLLTAVMLMRKVRGHDTAFASTLFIVAGALLWILPLFRERYVHFTAVSVAFSGALFARILYGILKGRFGRTLSIGFCAGVFALLLLPVWSFVRTIPTLGLPEYERIDLMEMLEWMRDRTPQTSYYLNPVTLPEYGVLSSWGLGAYISTIARRPTVATNFGWETHGLYESSEFMSSLKQEEADQIAAKNRVRYLVMSHTEDLERSYAIANMERFSMNKMGSASAGFNPLQSNYVQLYYHDGASYLVQGAERRAMGSYRLIYESRNGIPVAGPGMLPYYKIFERVQGARLRVVAQQGTSIELCLSLSGGNGRAVMYHDRVEADSKGIAELVVPYSTDRPSGDFTPSGAYTVSVDGKLSRVSVTENEVRNGALLQLPAL